MNPLFDRKTRFLTDRVGFSTNDAGFSVIKWILRRKSRFPTEEVCFLTDNVSFFSDSVSFISSKKMLARAYLVNVQCILSEKNLFPFCPVEIQHLPISPHPRLKVRFFSQ